MIIVKVPATSANIGPGFDTLGIALEMYNEFHFKKNETWSFTGFASDYMELNNNLVAQSALKAYEYANKEPIPLSISIVEGVPNSRGLGSSATCIVAGIKAANYFMGNILSNDELLQIATNIEGHPDNVAPAIFGGLVSGINGKKIIKIKYDVSQELKFVVCVPPFKLNTRDARRVLPTKMDYCDVVHNVSRAVNIPYAFKNGDVELLSTLLDDRMHEPYRLGLIPESTKIKTLAKKLGLPFCLSGSGSTLMIISKGSGVIWDLERLKLSSNWVFKALKVDNDGATVTEV